jgi:lipopolysaccharide export LptBFGC system permease protein LptF
VAPSEDVLKEQIDGAKRTVETDLAELRTQLAGLQRKLALALAVLATVLIAMKVGRRIWRRSRD